MVTTDSVLFLLDNARSVQTTYFFVIKKKRKIIRSRIARAPSSKISLSKTFLIFHRYRVQHVGQNIMNGRTTPRKLLTLITYKTLYSNGIRNELQSLPKCIIHELNEKNREIYIVRYSRDLLAAQPPRGYTRVINTLNTHRSMPINPIVRRFFFFLSFSVIVVAHRRYSGKEVR